MWFKDLVLGSEDSFYINLITLKSFIALSIRVRKGVERSTSEKSLRIVHSRITFQKKEVARHEDSEKFIGMSKCSIYFFYGGGGYPKYPCSHTCSDGVGRCYKVYDD